MAYAKCFIIVFSIVFCVGLTVVLLSIYPPFPSPEETVPNNEADEQKNLLTYEDKEKVLESFMTRSNLEKYYGPETVAKFPTLPNLDKPALQGHSILDLFKSDAERDKIDRAKVTFYLYTNPDMPNKRTELKINDTKILDSSGFDPYAPTKIITHGYLSNHQSGPGIPLKTAYLDQRKSLGGKMNIILVDWWDLAGPFKPAQQEHGLLEIFYLPPARNTKLVGSQIARLIDFLVQQGKAPLTSFHLIGHSLGAHAMGWAARSITDYSTTTPGKRIPRITALDPASPCFEHVWSICTSDAYRAVSTEDTDFLDVIHTHGNLLGYHTAIGHADFFPNSGISQPGCSTVFGGFFSCSHGRAVDYMVESIKAPLGPAFVAHECDKGWEAFENGECASRTTNSRSYGGVKTVSMGENCPKNARGQFYLETNSKSPFRVEAGKWQTINGELCKDECAKQGEKYFWCNTADSWDYCALAGQDYYGQECTDRCRRAGKSYRWCNLKKGSWGYCSAHKANIS